MGKLIQNINKKRNEDGSLELEFEFKEDQSEEEVQAIKDFIVSLFEE